MNNNKRRRSLLNTRYKFVAVNIHEAVNVKRRERRKCDLKKIYPIIIVSRVRTLISRRLYGKPESYIEIKCVYPAGSKRRGQLLKTGNS